MELITTYKAQEIRAHVKERHNWGAYFLIDDFIKNEIFCELCSSYNKLKTNKAVFNSIQEANVWRGKEPKGINLMFGGAGANIQDFKELLEIGKEWKVFLETIYSDSCFKYLNEIFSKSEAFKNNVTLDDMKEGKIGCKLSSQTNNFGDRIHQDATQKVLSFLLYLDNKGWDNSSEGGTDLWEVTDNVIPYDKSNNSLDIKMRQGRFKAASHSLKHSEADKIKKFLSIDFKPNRFVGFVRTSNSYHSVPPRILPSNITRDCFQINIWNFNRKNTYSKIQQLINFPEKIYKKITSKIIS